MRDKSPVTRPLHESPNSTSAACDADRAPIPGSITAVAQRRNSAGPRHTGPVCPLGTDAGPGTVEGWSKAPMIHATHSDILRNEFLEPDQEVACQSKYLQSHSMQPPQHSACCYLRSILAAGMIQHSLSSSIYIGVAGS